MGNLVVSEFITLDGVIDDPGGQSTEHGGWAFRFDRGEEGNRLKYDELMAADAMLLGRNTYNGFAAAWPNMNQDEFGQKMNSMPKHVVSSSELDPDWENSTRLEGDLAEAVRALKERYSGDILVAGSRRLVQSLNELELIDRLNLLVYPIVLGQGMRLFPESGPQRSLRLLEAKAAGQCSILLYAAGAGA